MGIFKCTAFIDPGALVATHFGVSQALFQGRLGAVSGAATGNQCKVVV